MTDDSAPAARSGRGRTGLPLLWGAALLLAILALVRLLLPAIEDHERANERALEMRRETERKERAVDRARRDVNGLESGDGIAVRRALGEQGYVPEGSVRVKER